MSTAKPVPNGISFKRKRRDSAGESDVTQTSYTPAVKTAAAKPPSTQTGSLSLPSQWQLIFDDIAGNGIILPPTVVAKFVEIHATCLSDFKRSQTALQKAVASGAKHASNSSNRSIPTTVTSSLRVPNTQTIKAAVGAEDDPRVVEAKAVVQNEIASTSIKAVEYLTTFYTVQVELCRAKVNLPTVAEAFAASLTAYASGIITAGGGDDPTVWNPVILRLKAALLSELLNLNFEFVAALEKEAEVKESRANAVATARADAEMTKATKPIEEIIDEKVEERYAKLEKTLRKQAKSAPSEAPSSSKAPPPPKSKQKPSTTTEATTNPKAKKATEKPKKAAAPSRKGKEKAQDDGDTARRERDAAPVKKKKQKSNPKPETADSDSG